ncbi:cyclic nucleotide-dependent protein kinase [Holotrichia oblita]|uniref:Cyclic nucleotide-dependent protein kinase n=1 Tax=Holotrichia oblita TaxID=644536 RepID=A0ACB9TCU4_HOLOL|nr:cyclic nucleotide-dependent protein kinase [Holotrichia oblita]
MPSCFGRSKKSGTYTPNRGSTSSNSPTISVTEIRRDGIPAAPRSVSMASVEKHAKTPEELETIKRAVKENEFLRNILNDEQIEQIAEAMFPQEVQENETIIQEGDEGSQMYVSQSGIYWVVIKHKKVHSFSHPTVFGELAILYKAKRLATIKAITKGKVWMIKRDTYQRILIRNARTQEDELMSFLKKVPNVNKLRDEKLQTLMKIFKTEFFTPDTVIVREGEIGDKFYIIRVGSASVSKEVDGKVADLIKGDFFGERALFETNDKRQATVIAQNPGAECLTLTRTQFLEYFDSNVFNVPAVEDSIMVNADSDRVNADPDRVNADPDRVNADPDRVNTDPDRVNADPDRVNADPDRVNAEPDRVNADPG